MFLLPVNDVEGIFALSEKNAIAQVKHSNNLNLSTKRCS